MVGDPLYRPYASWLQIDNPDSGKGNVWKMSYDFAVHNFAKGSAQYRALGRQVATSAHNCPMLEDLGLMEANAGNFASAINYFGQTRLSYAAVRDDILRVILEEADA